MPLYLKKKIKPPLIKNMLCIVLFKFAEWFLNMKLKM